jgi:uncharacterized protein YuzE
MKLIVQYSGDVDFLTLWNGRLTDGGEDVSAGLTAFFDDSDDSVVSFTIQGAVHYLAPILFGPPGDGGIVNRKVEQKGYLEDVPLLIEYNTVSDTLRLWNGRRASKKQEVADTLIAELDAEGEAVGFTLEQAAWQLRPFLREKGIDF